MEDNFNRFTPYPLFDIHGHDLGQRRIQLFYKGHARTAEWLLETGKKLVVDEGIRVTPKENDRAIMGRGPALNWSAVLHDLGTEAIEREIRTWYRDNREKVHQAVRFPHVDFLHGMWHGMTIHQKPYHDHVYALARHFVAAIPRGAPIQGTNRFWWALRLRRIMLDEYKRDILPSRRVAYLNLVPVDGLDDSVEAG